MNSFIRSVIIIDPNSKHNGKKRDIIIENGKITAIQSNLENPKGYKEIKKKNLHVSPGWFDMSVDFCDPGNEHREDLQSGLEAAMNGGYTGVLIMPNTEPVVSTKSQVEYIKNRNSTHLVDTEVCASLSAQGQGEQISDHGDLWEAGSRAVSDYKNPIENPELMIRALEYTQNFGNLVIVFPFDKGISPGGLMNEGQTSVSLGLKGIPHLSEEIRLRRDIELLKYAGGRMHVNLISTKNSVNLIREAKKEGLKITCGIAGHQISYFDTDLSEFDTRHKVLPPYRTENDNKALIKGLGDGTIDIICSDHTPIDIDHKKIEFEYAEFGISGIESNFSSIKTALGTKVKLDKLVQAMSVNPRKILGLETIEISEGNLANLTIFDPEEEYRFDLDQMSSKSKNNPFGNSKLTGRVYGVINNNKIKVWA